MNSVVRVAINNNFNCTLPEWKQLDEFAQANPDKTFFVNSNIHTPQLKTIKDHPYKAVVTVNPGITGTKADSKKVLKTIAMIRNHIAFVRIKFTPGNGYFLELLTMFLALKISTVITLQRFNNLKTLSRFTDRKYYQYSCSRFRLTGPMLKIITQLVARYQAKKYPIWICDQANLGCKACGLCSKLVTGKSLKIYSLNLSSSGICPYNCPDCYAKTMQNFCRKIGHNPITYDTIKQNKKQAGRTTHIKETLKHV